MIGGYRTPDTGDDAAYWRVKKVYGSATQYPCLDCDAPADHWTYDHTDHQERMGSNNCPYSLNTKHYVPRCTSCHAKFDRIHKC